MLWICLTAWAGLFIWYFRMRKKAEDHKLVRRIFCLAATGFIAGTALCLPIGVRKVSGDEKAELQLERGALGSQPTEEKLEVSVGNQEPERFYHGFVLGLIADQTDIYEIRSNRESGFGRYDVMMVPKEREKTKIPAIILEFKVKNNKKEQTLEENSTVITSADQRKKYDAELLARGIPKEKIRHYGFAFEGKNVLILD